MIKYIRGFLYSIQQTVLKDVYTYIPLLISSVVWMISVIVASIYIYPLQDPLILKVTQGGSIAQTGGWHHILYILGILFLFLCINTVIASNLYLRKKVLSYILFFATIWIETMGLFLLVYIFLLNT